MNKVEPIRNIVQLNQMKENLKKMNEKYYILFEIGVNSGLRVSDLRKLQVKDVKYGDYIYITEQKTGKNKRFLLNAHVRQEVMEYITRNKLNDDDYIVQSQKGINQPLSRVQVYHVLNLAAEGFGIRIGTHTMRKTFGYWHYQRYQDVAMLQMIFNHSSPSVTLRYIGISDDMIDATLREFYI
ncbi:Phage integrase family protein [Lachnospiraceae bacterium KH1T2]|nr:Phage integrase family protein [Lachnospiraceae bacterium KH1T2]